MVINNIMYYEHFQFDRDLPALKTLTNALSFKVQTRGVLLTEHNLTDVKTSMALLGEFYQNACDFYFILLIIMLKKN